MRGDKNNSRYNKKNTADYNNAHNPEERSTHIRIDLSDSIDPDAIMFWSGCVWAWYQRRAMLFQGRRKSTATATTISS